MKIDTKSLVLLSVFTAMIILLGMTPIGLIPIGLINLTIVHIPVIIGTLILGTKRGIILGAAFGIVSTLAAFGMSLAAQSGLAAAILGCKPLGPVAVIFMCIAPRVCIPLVTGTVNKLILGTGKNAVSAEQISTKRKIVATVVAAFAGSITNTILYLGCMGTFLGIYGMWGRFTKILTVIMCVAALCEAIAAAVVAVPTVSALSKFTEKKNVN